LLRSRSAALAWSCASGVFLPAGIIGPCRYERRLARSLRRRAALQRRGERADPPSGADGRAERPRLRNHFCR
jgi:hypothetical protein